MFFSKILINYLLYIMKNKDMHKIFIKPINKNIKHSITSKVYVKILKINSKTLIFLFHYLLQPIFQNNNKQQKTLMKIT